MFYKWIKKVDCLIEFIGCMMFVWNCRGLIFDLICKCRFCFVNICDKFKIILIKLLICKIKIDFLLIFNRFLERIGISFVRNDFEICFIFVICLKL